MTAKLQLPEVEPAWTERQKQVLDLLTSGKTNAEIGDELGIGLDGVKWHVSEILQKLNVNSREEAAEYWRYRNGLKMRFLRVSGALTSPIALRWIGAGTAAVVGAAAGVVIALALMSGGGDEAGAPGDADSPTVPSTLTTGSLTPTTATATPQAASTPFPSVTEVTHVSLPASGEIAPGWGLVIGNALTGGAEVWLFPDGEQATGISPSGRYFASRDSLYDGWTGARSAVSGLDVPIVLASYAPNDELVYLQDESGEGLVASLDGKEVARLPQFGARPSARQLDVVWSADSRGVAITRYGDTTSRTDVVIDGSLQPDLPSNGMAGWSHEGLRLAVTRDNPAIYDFETGDVLPLAASGAYPSWSEADVYVAIDASAAGQGLLSVLDAETGDEILRIYNQSACFDIYWGPSNTLPGTAEEVVQVPSGELRPPPAGGGYQTPQFPALRVTQQQAEWYTPSGAVYARSGISDEALWAASFAWTRRDIDQWPPVLGLGLGGKDACLGSPPAVAVAKPPFTPDQVPKPTPTPDK